MNLENLYNKTKKNTQNKFWANILSYSLAIVFTLGIVYILNFLWNYVAPIWKFPTLTYLQFLISWFLFTIFLMPFSGFTKSRRDYIPPHVIAFRKDNPNEGH